jgi:hypothetical protein
MKKQDHVSEKQKEDRKFLENILESKNIPASDKINNMGLYLKTGSLSHILFCNEAYLLIKDIPGVIMEFGVWYGQNLVLFENLRAIYEPFNKLRKIIGFDTFETGFSNSILTDKDITIKGEKLHLSANTKNNFYPTLEKVKKNIEKFSENSNTKIILVKGDILKTLKKKSNVPEKISFLRLDTDLYATTKFQLEILFPKLVKGGILHIDDYGFFPGVQKAVDEYFKDKKIWLHRVDFTCRLLVKD